MRGGRNRTIKALRKTRNKLNSTKAIGVRSATHIHVFTPGV